MTPDLEQAAEGMREVCDKFEKWLRGEAIGTLCKDRAQTYVAIADDVATAVAVYEEAKAPKPEPDASAELDGPNMPYETRAPRPGDTLYDVAHAPQEAMPPGVTVTISPSLAFQDAFMYAGVLDGIDGGCFCVNGEVDHEEKPFRTAEDAEAGCLEMMTKLLNRLMDRPGGILAIAPEELTNLKFARE